jgi:hypothetical protein
VLARSDPTIVAADRWPVRSVPLRTTTHPLMKQPRRAKTVRFLLTDDDIYEWNEGYHYRLYE